MMKHFILWVGLILLFGGCSVRKYEISEPKLIVLKTPKLKFADTGYVRSSGESVKLSVFNAGVAVANIEINHLVCVDNEGCLDKSTFNAEYLNEHYPDNIMQNILLGKPIFKRQSLQHNTEGFEQRIQNGSIDVIYRVDARQIYFKDKKNKILIKIRAIPGQ